MTFYRNHYRTNGGCSAGYGWFSSRAAAEQAARAADQNADDPEDLTDPVAERIEIEPTRRGILDALNRHASHAENG